MYKAKKCWIVVPIMFCSLVLGASLETNRVLADENTQVEAVSQTVDRQTDTDSKTAQPVTEVEDNTKNGEQDKNIVETEADTVNENSSTAPNESLTQVSTNNASETNLTSESQQSDVAQNKATTDENEQKTPEASENSSSNQVQKVENTSTTFSAPTDYVEKKQDGHWYLYDKQSNVPYTGFQKLKDDRVVYYNKDGQMQYGWQWVENATRYFDTFDGKMAIGQQNINGHWYLFNEKGEMQRGFQQIPDQNKTVYYNKDGWMLYGQQNIGGYWYNFDTFDGAMKTGFVKIPDQNKTVYYNKQGQMQYGWQWVENATHYFDTFNGKMAIGQQNINDHWYLFNEKGEMQRGFQYIAAQNKTVYYNKDGWMLYGVQQIGPDKYYFDIVTGAMKKDDVVFDKADGKLSYYGNDGKQVKGIIVLDGKEYNFADGTLISDGQQLVTIKGKSYLLNNSRVVTGQQKLAGYWYYFDINTGVMAHGFQYLADQNKTVYYNDQGQMVYGWKDISGRRYFFDRVTGAKASSEILWIDGNAYAFDSQGGAHSFAELAQLVNQLGSNIAVAIQSQKSGQIYSYSNYGNMRFRTASTVKVAVLAELLHNTGGNLTAYQRRLAENMIRNSDNASTTELITYHLYEAGNPVNKLYRDLGMTETTPGSASWGSTLTTPADQLKLLYQIYMTDNSVYLNQNSQNYIKELMHTINASQRWGISAGSNDFYLKNGWVTYDVPWYVNSIGFIPNNGHGYTIAIYSYNNSLATGINKVEQVARKVSQMLK